MENNKGFTLIELLAVIIILGIIMIIAIPSVTNYISDSRKEAYILSVKEVSNGISHKINSGEYPFFDKNVNYYIPFECTEMENENTSPFGKWKEAYILVNYNGEGYDYYFTGYDEVGYGTTNIIPIKILDKDMINPGQSNLNNKRAIARDNIAIIDKNSCTANSLETEVAQDKVNYDGSEIKKDLLKDIVQVGDYVMYDAGTWEETKPMPEETEYYTFGGYTAGHSRNEFVNCTGNGKYYDGWRVLGIEGDSVVLIHAGTPECYRNAKLLEEENLANFKNNNWEKYVNSKYALSSQSIDYDIINKLLYNEEKKIGYTTHFDLDILSGEYFLANILSRYLSTYYYNTYMKKHIVISFPSYLSGVRPVVKLKSGVFVDGKVEDASGNPTWIIGIK